MDLLTVPGTFCYIYLPGGKRVFIRVSVKKAILAIQWIWAQLMVHHLLRVKWLNSPQSTDDGLWYIGKKTWDSLGTVIYLSGTCLRSHMPS